MSETIYALSSGAGRAGIAIIRISGPAAGEALKALSGKEPVARVAQRTRLRNPENQEHLDDGIVIWFPEPASFTGENVAELHVHGGPAVVAAILEALGRYDGLRLALPGEFTKRAFLSGKLDLTAAEGLADLIDAETDAQRRQALRQSDGRLGRLYDDWRDRLTVLLAHFEAAIDFPDEGLPESVESAVRDKISEMLVEFIQHLDDDRGERLRDGLHIAILGAPNVGKSSLLNLLAQRDAAIVSEQAGTTRDVIEVRLDLGGYPLVLADTAGLRESTDSIEEEGVRRAKGHAGLSDLKLLVFDASNFELNIADADVRALVDANTIVVFNKIDLCGGSDGPKWRDDCGPVAVCSISVRTGEGVEVLVSALLTAVAVRMGQATAPMITRTRHREAVSACRDALERALQTMEAEFAAEDLRLAIRALGRITGAVDVEDLLDVIFRDFCIGK